MTSISGLLFILLFSLKFKGLAKNTRDKNVLKIKKIKSCILPLNLLNFAINFVFS